MGEVVAPKLSRKEAIILERLGEGQPDAVAAFNEIIRRGEVAAPTEKARMLRSAFVKIAAARGGE